MEHHFFHAAIVGLAIPVALYLLAKALIFKYKLMMSCQPEPDPIAEHGVRIKEVLKFFLGQRKLFQDPAAGFMHALIFWGFLILLLRSLTLFGMAFAGFSFHLPFLGADHLPGKCYSFLKDMANVWVLIMVLYAMTRRYILRIPRLLNTPGALFVLLMILGLMVTDMVFDTVLAASEGARFAAWSPIGTGFGALISGGKPVTSSAFAAVGHIAYLAHVLGLLVFLVYLPAGKHMHIITAIFNIYLRPLHRTGRLTKLDLEDESIESFGVSQIEEFTWKDVLNFYTCTECGRCTDACPASRTQKALSPRDLTNNLKHFLVDDEAERILSGDKDAEPSRELVPEVVQPDELWSCTTCHACEQACPLNISYVQRINSMRRSEVLNFSRFPAELKRVFKGLENNSNPWGVGSSTRMDWARDLDIPLWDDHPDAEYLLFLGCAASFDDRAQQVSRALIRFLKAHGISFAVIGADEQCCGETARRLGEEALGQMLMETNVELFNEMGVKKILTACPHCYNTFKNEYPDFGGKYEVVHHSQLIADLVKAGRVKPAQKPGEAFIIHDSCYLGRVNNVYEPARTTVDAIPGARRMEADESRESALCCGAGGGLFWLEEKGERINTLRFNQLAEYHPTTIVTSCPYCLVMLNDASKDAESLKIQVRDIVEILE